MKQQSEFSRISRSFTKSIVDNVNSMLGILPKPLSFEVTMPKKTVRQRMLKAKAAPRKKHTVSGDAKRLGKSIKASAKRVVTKARSKAAKKVAPKKAVKRSRTIIALKRKPVAHSSHARAA
jgi:hypothetical protein